MKLFEYAITHHPKTAKEQRDAGKEAKSVLLNGGVEQVLANDETQVTLMAARAIPADFMDKLDQIEIAVRPF